MVCEFCKGNYQDRCIFYPGNRFNRNNWNCKTLQIFKDYCVIYGFVYKNELNDGVIYVLPTHKFGFIIAHSLKDNLNSIVLMRLHERMYSRASPKHLFETLNYYHNMELIKWKRKQKS